MTRLRPLPEDDGPPPGRVEVEMDVRPDATTILVRGELDLVAMPVLAGHLALVARDKPSRLVFDLAGTRFMDCGSARLIAGSGQWLRDGRRPVIRRPGPSVRRVLWLTGLDADCEIEELAAGNIRTWCLCGSQDSREQADERLDTRRAARA
ncbi:MAG: STAS domain-containing protein [Streptosporangiaceae bacterium]|jgi:anti-anti-sigma factor